MTLHLPGRFGAAFLITGIVAVGLLITSESVVCWNALDPEYLAPGKGRTLSWVRGLTWSADGSTLFSESRGERFLEFKLTAHDMTLADGRGSVRDETVGIAAIEACLSPHARKVLLTTERGDLEWVDLASLETTEFKAPPSAIFKRPTVSHDASLLAAVTDRGGIYLRQATQGTMITCESSESEQVTKLRFSDDDQQLLACRFNGKVEIWDTRTGTLRRCLNGQPGPVAAAFLQDGTKVISSLGGNDVQISDLETGEICWREPHGLRGLKCVWRLESSPDGSLVAWSGMDTQVVIWDLKQSRKRIEFENPSHVSNISFSPDNRYLAVAGSEPVIRIYDTSTGHEDRQVDTRQTASPQ